MYIYIYTYPNANGDNLIYAVVPSTLSIDSSTRLHAMLWYSSLQTCHPTVLHAYNTGAGYQAIYLLLTTCVYIYIYIYVYTGRTTLASSGLLRRRWRAPRLVIWWFLHCLGNDYFICIYIYIYVCMYVMYVM